MRLVPLSMFVLAGAFALSCKGEVVTEGLEEPISVQGGQFFEGALPGTPPGQPPVAPRPISASTDRTALRPGITGVPFSGWATIDAVAVAARFDGQGQGYWVVPTGPLDPQVEGDPVRVWRFVTDLHASLPPGRQRFVVAAIDDAGRAGTQVDSTVCINRSVPDNGNACDPAKAPPEFVVSLAWDRPADLDLILFAPDNQAISSRSPSKGLAEDAQVSRASLDKTPPGVGYLDVDSNSGCTPGRQLENVVFQERPPPGSYLVYVNLHDACGEPAVHYTVTRHGRTAGPGAGTFAVTELDRKSGTALAVQANGSSKFGTFVVEYLVP